jgi:uracil-DNA glycosylase
MNQSKTSKLVKPVKPSALAMSITPESMFKRKLLRDISTDWLELLDNSTLDMVISELYNVPDITPGVDKIFEFARLTSLRNTKVIIIAQDPYPKKGDAHGLAFSSLSGVPASLRNIYKCLVKNKIMESIPTTGNLEYWAKQGVLLLNRALTTVIGRSNVHKDIWNQYTIDLIKTLTSRKPMIVFLWGNAAKNLNDESIIHGKSIVYEWSHPSPLAQAKQAFVDCDHFTNANKVLITLGHTVIDWNIAPPQSAIELAFNITPGTTVVFTDGSCEPNKACPESIGGYAACFSLGMFKDTVLYGNIETDVEYATNQRAEGIAILKTFEYLLNHTDEWTDCIIVSDSDFWIKMIEIYMPEWYRKNGFDSFEEKKNPDLTKKIYTVYMELTDSGKNILFRHVKSHNKNGWKSYNIDTYERFCHDSNEYVDHFAEFARKELAPGQHITEDVEFSE